LIPTDAPIHPSTGPSHPRPNSIPLCPKGYVLVLQATGQQFKLAHADGQNISAIFDMYSTIPRLNAHACCEIHTGRMSKAWDSNPNVQKVAETPVVPSDGPVCAGRRFGVSHRPIFIHPNHPFRPGGHVEVEGQLHSGPVVPRKGPSQPGLGPTDNAPKGSFSARPWTHQQGAIHSIISSRFGLKFVHVQSLHDVREGPIKTLAGGRRCTT
jgi:hypothetical protein